MAKKLPEDREKDLVQLIEDYGIAGLLRSLHDICYRRADSLEKNFDLKANSRTWRVIGNEIDHAADTASFYDK
jgi:hypothetical protein